MTVLGIETSCDETAAAVVRGDARSVPTLLSNIVLSQTDQHQIYGGVVPEIAARSHIDALDGIIGEALTKAGIGFEDLDAIAATAGPGLIGGVIVGLMTAKGIAAVHGLPLVAVNHLEAHALSAGIADRVPFPYLLLLVSGGHCQLAAVETVGRYEVLGSTIDDAIGEAFDKTAQLLGLGYPGGPALEEAARTGDPARFDLPRPLIGTERPDFSFSGLKTAVRRQLETLAGPDRILSDQDRADMAASFQETVARVLVDRAGIAMDLFKARHGQPADGAFPFVVAGGVAANKHLRARLETLCDETGFVLKAPPLSLCTDNAAMVAWAGLLRHELGIEDVLSVAPRARWPLSELGEPPQGVPS